MGKKLAATVGGVHKIGKKIFLTGEDLLHHKVKKAFITKDGVHRLVFSSGTVWEKYDCQFSTCYEKINWYNKKMAAGDWNNHEFYGSYEFSSENGVSMMDKAEVNLNEDVDSIVGMYLEEALDADAEAVWVVTEAGYNENGFPYYWYETVLSYERKEGWEATDHIGTIEAEEGDLPESGTLIEGSVEDGFFVLEIDGEYYYYIAKE